MAAQGWWIGAWWSGPAVVPATDPEEPADSLLTAIWRFADARGSLAESFGRQGWLWKNKAPRDVPLPYAVVFEAGATAETGSGDTYYQIVLIQFNVFATSEVEAKALGDDVSDAFAPYFGQDPMVFQGGVDVDRWVESGDRLERDFGRGKGGVPVFVQRINFGWRIERTYAPD